MAGVWRNEVGPHLGWRACTKRIEVPERGAFADDTNPFALFERFFAEARFDMPPAKRKWTLCCGPP